MAEAPVSSILGRLAAITLENGEQELKLVAGVEKDVVKLRRNFEAIQDVLEDAEEKQIMDRNIKRWLDKLKDVSYNMEDVLDEWNTALSKSQMDVVRAASIPKKMVSPFVSCFSFGRRIIRRYDVGTKIKGINEELDEIAKEKDRYHFATREIREPRRLEETTSFIDVSEVKGRDDIRDKLIRQLTFVTGEEGCISTVSIVGMGGIGKTALAQTVFDEIRRRNSFDKAVWVCVSDFFNPTKVAREILEGLGSDLSSCQNPISLQCLLNGIFERTKDMKLFLVFDDVWTERDEDWQALKAALQHCKQGSSILVTTRKESVAMVMRSSHVFSLELLSDEVCWDIIKQVVCFGREEGECGDFEDVGMGIARKCRGLPLAAKTLGSLLRHKRRRAEWEEVLNSEFWELKIAEEYIFRPLLLSYYNLPSMTKRCLLYCVIFPKDHVMSRNELILHWKVQGFLDFDDDLKSEMKGEEHFYHLVGHSFFQDLAKDTSGNIVTCKMHDLIHDFLWFMTKGVDLDGNSSPGSVSKTTRHLRITIGQGNTLPTYINAGVEKLRTLVVTGQSCDVTCESLKKLFNEAKCLRLLDFQLSNSGEVDKEIRLPEEICNLIHLRYLSFHGHRTLALPESVCELRNLQYLSLRGCNKLPDEMEKLINLKYLYTYACSDLKYYPKGIGRLTGLKRLNKAIARVDCNHARIFSVGDLENLDLLSGDVYLVLRGNSINREEVERAKLHNKIHLSNLYVVLRTMNGEISQQLYDDFIQALNPSPSVAMLLL